MLTTEGGRTTTLSDAFVLVSDTNSIPFVYIQYHGIDENSTKTIDSSMFSPDFIPRQKKKNCKYHRLFCKSVQTFHAKEVCPIFWDRPPSEAAFLAERFL